MNNPPYTRIDNSSTMPPWPASSEDEWLKVESYWPIIGGVAETPTQRLAFRVYRRDLLHPAAQASPSVQNHRSPRVVSIRVRL